MALIGFAGFLFLCIMAVYKFNEKFVTVFPLCIGSWIFILYILAFFQKLHWIDYLGGGVFLFIIAYFVKRKDKLLEKKNLVICNSTFVLIIIYFLLWFINKNRIAWGGDELGVWAIEVKSIFYVNGFADKFKNVALGYGDYHPGQMLFEWWICHFDSEKFNEGLMYVGYNFLYVSFLAPMLKILDNRKDKGIFLDGILFFIAILLLPSCVDATSYLFLSVELLISVIYANLLYLAFEKDDNKLFYDLKITTYLFLLMLLKNIAVIYVLLFWVLILFLKKGSRELKNYINKKKVIIIMLMSSLPILIWKIYCKVWDRTNYFSTISENLIKDIATKSFQFSSDTKQLIISFIKSLVLEPLHSDRTIFLDISVIICVMITIYLLHIAFNKENVRRIIFVHYLVSVLVLLAGVLMMHIFIFRESQYVYTSNMIYSISRYVEPIFLGNIILAFMVIINGCVNLDRKRSDMLVIIIFIFFCANYGTLYNKIIDYSPIRETVIAERTEVSNQNIKLLNEINEKQIDGRILYVVNSIDNIDPMAQRRFSYIISPASIIYQFVDISTVDKERNYSDVLWQINRNNCQYVFFKELPKDYLELFEFSSAECLENKLLKIEKDLSGNIYFAPIN